MLRPRDDMRGLRPILLETMALMYPVADVLRELLRAWIAIAASKLQDAGLE